MLDQAGTPFHLRGHEGSVIRNGDHRVMVPGNNVARFQYELNVLPEGVDYPRLSG